MIHIYIMSVKPLLEHDVYTEAAGKVSGQRREKAERAKRPGDRALSLGAGLLLQYGVKRYREESWKDCPAGETPVCSIVQTEEVLRAIEVPEELSCGCGPHGKPYLEHDPEIFFSLSHSGEYAMCALADREIGADIQRRQDACRGDRVAARWFAREELRYYEKARTGQERSDWFCRLWAAKEAYMKLTGEGLSRETKSFFVDLEQGTINGGEDKSLCARLYEPAAPEGYAAAVCVYHENCHPIGTDHKNLS
ncbi:MAG: 4'-phosphopantetheinyl transferase superfamily protein [Lachnospiraceae bacterium]|nr:4'-phosphopantetheinyl transferase superfamily protein [Lachnospiraceae bacterium]